MVPTGLGSQKNIAFIYLCIILGCDLGLLVLSSYLIAEMYMIIHGPMAKRVLADRLTT